MLSVVHPHQIKDNQVTWWYKARMQKQRKDVERQLFVVSPIVKELSEVHALPGLNIVLARLRKIQNRR